MRGGAALESLARPGAIFFDKTGTVTEGRTALLSWEGPEEAKPLVLAGLGWEQRISLKNIPRT